MNQTLSDIIALESDYRPNELVLNKVRSTTCLAFVGPTGVGKSTCVDLLTEQSPEFGPVARFTSRPPRIGHQTDDYIFYDHEKELETILALAQSGQFLQYAVHPANGYVYGAQLTHGLPFTVIDLVYSGVDALRSLPFKQVHVFVLTTDFETWRQRLTTRSQSEGDTAARVKEAIDSLSWALDQDKAALHWIHTRKGELEDTAREALLRAQKGSATNHTTDRDLGDSFLKQIVAYKNNTTQ